MNPHRRAHPSRGVSNGADPIRSFAFLSDDRWILTVSKPPEPGQCEMCEWTEILVTAVPQSTCAGNTISLARRKRWLLHLLGRHLDLMGNVRLCSMLSVIRSTQSVATFIRKMTPLAASFVDQVCAPTFPTMVRAVCVWTCTRPTTVRNRWRGARRDRHSSGPVLPANEATR